MHAELFVGDADGPELTIDTADDGTALADGRGWSCGNCGTLYVDRGKADVCRGEPDAIVTETPREEPSGFPPCQAPGGYCDPDF